MQSEDPFQDGYSEVRDWIEGKDSLYSVAQDWEQLLYRILRLLIPICIIVILIKLII